MKNFLKIGLTSLFLLSLSNNAYSIEIQLGAGERVESKRECRDAIRFGKVLSNQTYGMGYQAFLLIRQ